MSLSFKCKLNSSIIKEKLNANNKEIKILKKVKIKSVMWNKIFHSQSVSAYWEAFFSN